MSLERALRMARHNEVMGLPRMGACIVDRYGKVLSLGQNSRKSHPLAAKFGRHPDAIYIHAELAAIIGAIRYYGIRSLEGSTLYVARVLKNGSKALARPCIGCQRAIAAFNIGEVHWTLENN